MKRLQIHQALVLLLSISLVTLPVSGGVVGKAFPRTGNVTLNKLPLSIETTVYTGDTLATAKHGLAFAALSGGNRVHLGPDTTIAIAEGESLTVGLTRGMVAVRSGDNPAVLNAAGVVIRTGADARYEVALDRNAVVVSSHKGEVEVQGSNRSFTVPSGKAMRFELAANTPLGPTGSGANNLAAGAIIAIVAAIATASVTTALAVKYNNDRDDARQACRDLAAAASPAQPVPPECQ